MTKLAIAGCQVQKGDWLTFFTPKAHPEWLNRGHVTYLNEHGFIQISWGDRDDKIRDLPGSSDIASELAPNLKSIWRRDAQGLWGILAAVSAASCG